MRFDLSRHAAERLTQRSRLTEEEFLDLANTSAYSLLYASHTEMYFLVWSIKDCAGYVLVTNPVMRRIITVFPALREDGSPTVMHCIRNGEDDWCHVKRRSLEQAMQRAGIEPLPMDDPNGPIFYREDPKPRAWNYRWLVRFLVRDPGGATTSKSKMLGRESAIPPGDSPPTEVIQGALHAVKEFSGWDGRLSLICRDDRTVVDEWDLSDFAELPARATAPVPLTCPQIFGPVET